MSQHRLDHLDGAVSLQERTPAGWTHKKHTDLVTSWVSTKTGEFHIAIEVGTPQDGRWRVGGEIALEPRSGAYLPRLSQYYDSREKATDAAFQLLEAMQCQTMINQFIRGHSTLHVDTTSRPTLSEITNELRKYET